MPEKYFIERRSKLDMVFASIFLVTGYLPFMAFSLLIPGAVVGFKTPLNNQAISIALILIAQAYIIFLFIFRKKIKYYFSKQKFYVQKEKVKREKE